MREALLLKASKPNRRNVVLSLPGSSHVLDKNSELWTCILSFKKVYQYPPVHSCPKNIDVNNNLFPDEFGGLSMTALIFILIELKLIPMVMLNSCGISHTILIKISTKIIRFYVTRITFSRI